MTGTFFLVRAAAMATVKLPYDALFLELEASTVSSPSMKSFAFRGTRS